MQHKVSNFSSKPSQAYLPLTQPIVYPKIKILKFTVISTHQWQRQWFDGTLTLDLNFFTGSVQKYIMYSNSYLNVNHHHHIALVARISLTLSRHSSLSFIALGRSSGQHPVSSHNCWMYVRAGRPAFARPCVGIHKSTSLISSSLLLQQCPACLVRLTWIVFVIGGIWPYSWCLVGCCCQDLKLPKISVVNKSRNEEEAFELRSHLEEISILVSMSLSPINIKCWILQNVMLYFVCEIMLKLCVLNVKTRLLYYKAKLMLVIPMSANKAECFWMSSIE